MQNVREEARDIPVAGSYDVVVCGGGPAGVSAAASAAKNGASTLLIERTSSLGGLASGGPVLVMTGSSPSGTCGDVLEQLGEHKVVQDDGGVVFDPESLKSVLDTYVLDSGAHILLDTLVVGANCVDDRVRWVFIENKSGRQAITAKYVVDATGDADSAKWCSIDYLQPGNGVIRDISPVFRMGNVDVKAYRSYFHAKRNELPGSISLGDGVKLFYSGWYETMNPGELWLDALFFEGIDPTNAEDLSRAEILARQYVGLAVERIKELPGFERAFLTETSPMLGIRESRHIVGKYTLSADDSGIDHPDTVAFTKGAGNQFGKPLGIPYRCMLPEFMDNIVFAGRCISATQDVYDAVRSIPSCMATGQAAGTAAALGSAAGNPPIADIDIQSLKNSLRMHGVLV